MKAVWLGLCIAALLGVGAWYLTTTFLAQSSAQSFASPSGSVRLDDSD